MKDRKTSLEDIAKACGVSKATVSFVMNGKGDQYNISKAKQELILAKAKEMSYVPNFFARSLRKGETKTIGIVLPDISNTFYAQLCKEMQTDLYNSGYNAFIVNTNDDKETEKSQMLELIQRSIDAMIIAPSNYIEPLIPILVSTHIPVVFVDRMGDENADFVGIDNFKEAKELVKQFAAKPKKLGIIAPPTVEVKTLEERIRGLESAAKEIKASVQLIKMEESSSVNQELMKAAIEGGTDSFVFLNNLAAFSALSALRSLEKVSLTDVQIISFDDHEAYKFMRPAISALKQPISDMGRETVQRLISRLTEGKEPGKHLILPCEFQARDSHK